MFYYVKGEFGWRKQVSYFMVGLTPVDTGHATY